MIAVANDGARRPQRRRQVRTVLAHHTTGASNDPVEAANLLIKQVKRAGRGFRNFDDDRLRILLAGGLTRDRHTVTRLSIGDFKLSDPRSPRS